MSYDSVDEGAEIRACESCAEITRGWNQHGGGSRDPVAQFRFVAASSVSISRRGPIGWTAIGACRGLHHDHTQDACESGPRPACTCDAFRNDNQRDRATCYLRLSVGNPRAWLSGREFDALSVSNIRSIVCSPRSLSKPTRFSILIRCGSFAPVLM
jgi:hypothetical protein